MSREVPLPKNLKGSEAHQVHKTCVGLVGLLSCTGVGLGGYLEQLLQMHAQICSGEWMFLQHSPHLVWSPPASTFISVSYKNRLRSRHGPRGGPPHRRPSSEEGQRRHRAAAGTTAPVKHRGTTPAASAAIFVRGWWPPAAIFGLGHHPRPPPAAGGSRMRRAVAGGGGGMGRAALALWAVAVVAVWKLEPAAAGDPAGERRTGVRVLLGAGERDAASRPAAAAGGVGGMVARAGARASCEGAERESRLLRPAGQVPRHLRLLPASLPARGPSRVLDPQPLPRPPSAGRPLLLAGLFFPPLALGTP